MTKTTVIETYPANEAVLADAALPKDERTLPVYSIPTYRVEQLEAKWAKLCKRAAKLGLDAPRWERARLEERSWRENGHLRTERYLVIVVHPTPVVLAGWTFVATIQHTEAGNIIRGVPGSGVELPKSFRTVTASWCDHCRTERKRLETFVVAHEDGTLQRVGRNCLADFVATDRNGKGIAARLTWAVEVGALLDDMERLEGGGGRDDTVSTEYLVAKVCVAIRNGGWCSRGAARFGDKTASVDLALSVIACRKLGKKKGTLWAFEPEWDTTASDKEEAKAAIAWARDIDPDTDSDYLHNLRIACSFSRITYKEAGIVGSVIAAYRRAMEKELHLARDRECPRGQNWLAEPGDKFGRKLSAKDKAKGATAHDAVVATVVASRWFSSEFGESCKVTFETEARDVLVWWASNPGIVGVDGKPREMELGDTVSIAATVKKLGEYKGVKETVLTRAKCTLLTPEGVEGAA